MSTASRERWERARALFHLATESAPEGREALVAAASGDDVWLRDEVLSLLASDGDAVDFLDEPAARRLAATAAGPPPRLSAGERFGRYEIAGFLGAGAVSEVYRAHDTRLGRTVALKFLTDPTAPDAGSCLLREAQHASTLNHAHICTVHEVDEVDGRPFIVLEHIEGTTLHALTRRGPLPADTVVRWGAEIADALDHAHRRGVIHRDLKGSNVIVTPELQVKVLDFGLARRLERSAKSDAIASVLTDASVAGTLTHIAPEVFTGGDVDGRVDIWALGVMLYEMASGVVPFKGATAFATASAILDDAPAPLPASVPAALRDIITRCLSKDPAARFGSAAEVRRAVDLLRADLSAASQVRRRAVPGRLAAALVIVVAMATAFLMRAGFGRPSAVAAADRILAVLPFDDTSGGETQRFLADGMAEAIAAELGRIDAVRVIAPGSTRMFRGQADAVQGVGRGTGAGRVLEGQVTKTGDRVRLVARLVHASSGRVLWSAEYDRHGRELQALHGVVARDVAAAIAVSLDAEDARRLSVVRAVDPHVYEAYLKGRYYWNQRTADSLRAAIAHYEDAIRLDPTYAPAYAALADSYNQLGTQMVGSGSPLEWRPKAAEAAIRALQIDPELAEAHATLGYVRHYDWQWSEAEQAFRRAISLNPSYALARIWYANLLSGRGRVDEAVSQVIAASQLDPLSPLVGTNVGWVFHNARRYDEAIAVLLAVVARDPNYVQAHSRLAAAYGSSGRHDDALEAAETAVRLTDGSPSTLAAMAQAQALAGRHGEAERLLERLLAERVRRYVATGAVANAYAALGRTDEALRWLELSHAERTNNNAYLAVEPVYDGLRAEPRFHALLRATGLP